MMENSVYLSLQKIVGNDFVSNHTEELFLYSRDIGSGMSGKADYLVLPGGREEVQKVVEIACKNKIAITPMGAGLNLSGLTTPNRGGIVLDMKRMDKILEINETSRYVLVEPGVTLGKLLFYLKKHHPQLRFSVPDAPPTATITGNALFNGSGHISKYGAHPEMINGLEVVLPNAEICQLGSCSISPYWFSKSPLPDLIGLFVNWFGTTGIVTKLSLKLYPRHKIRRMLFFALPSPDAMPYVLQKLTETELIEDIIILVYKIDGRKNLTNLLVVYITAETPKEFDLKAELFKEILTRQNRKDNEIIHLPEEIFSPEFINNYMAEPKYEMKIADLKKGGGFEYLGVNFPLELIPDAYRKGCLIAQKYDFDGPVFTIRNIGIGQSVIFTFMYPFNRADEMSLENCRHALIETTQMALDLGGVPWKPTIEEQQMILKKMNPVTISLINKVKKTLDPNGIMNPGHWEIR